MLDFKIIQNEKQLASLVTRKIVVGFLHTYLGPYTDTISTISKAINYAFSPDSGRGGFLLVCVAVDSKFRNLGFGELVVEKAISTCEGDVALHCDFGNPAQRLYERMGFEVKYSEMRFYK